MCHCVCHGFDIAILLTSLACVSSQHTPMFYKRIHKMHHDFRMPNGFAAEYAHPVELVISNMMPLMMGPLVVALVTGRCHQVATLCWVIFRMFETVDAHCGYDLPFSPFGFFPMRPSSVSLWQGSGGGLFSFFAPVDRGVVAVVVFSIGIESLRLLDFFVWLRDVPPTLTFGIGCSSRHHRHCQTINLSRLPTDAAPVARRNALQFEHDWHHSKNAGNFGSFFTFWDDVMGTSRHAVLERIKLKKK